MRVRRTRAEQVEDNRARLMSAARKVFVKKGFHGASLDDVARAAGLTKGAVYARFASKGELMLALLEDRLSSRARDMLAVTKPGAGDATAASVAKQFAALVAQDPEWSLLVLEFRVHAARDRSLNRRFRTLNGRLREGIAEVARRAGAGDAAADGVARVAMALANGFALERWVDPEDFPEELFERATMVLTRGVSS